MKAMVFAAGLGTRLKPLTDTKPKALVETGGKPLLERSIEYLKSFHINDITVNIHHFGDQIVDFLQRHHNFGITIHISDETDMLLDTGGAILKAKPFLKGEEQILLINVDVVTNLNLHDLLKFHKSANALATLVVRERASSRMLMFDREGQLTGWKNTKSGEQKISSPGSCAESVPLAFSGIHIIEPELLTSITEKGKFSVIDLYLRLAATKRIRAFIDDNSLWVDLGTIDSITSWEQ